VLLGWEDLSARTHWALIDPSGLFADQSGVMEPPVLPPSSAPPAPPIAPVLPVAAVLPGSGPVFTLIAEGSGEGAAAGPVGVLAGAGTAATGGIVYYGTTATIAEMNESAAYQTEWQAVHDANVALLEIQHSPFHSGEERTRDNSQMATGAY